MWPRNALTERLGLEWPIIQAPMANAATPALAAAVSDAGGLGSLGLGTLAPERARTEIEDLRARTDRPFNLNVFCHDEPRAVAEGSAAMRRRLAALHGERGLGEVPDPGLPYRSFDAAMLAVLRRTRPQVVSFHFGLPEAETVATLKAEGAFVMSSATSTAEARWLEAQGVDAVIAQGIEAGGHRGSFLEADIDRQAGTMALVPQIVDAVTVPVIAAGGIADGRGIAAAFMLGASAVQIGTAFLRCPETSIHPQHRQALIEARDDATRLTRLFTGRPARSLVNQLMESLADAEDRAAPYPAQMSLVAPLRQAAPPGEEGQWMPLWAGQAASLAREMPAAEVVATLAREADDRLKGSR